MRVRLDRLLPERREALVEFASLGSGHAGRGFGRLRACGWPVLQIALSAGLVAVRDLAEALRGVATDLQQPGDGRALGEAAREGPAAPAPYPTATRTSR